MGQAKRRRQAGTYINTHTTAKPIWQKTPTMTTFGNVKGQTVPCTLEEYREGERDGRVALHEAGHSIGAWVMGLPIRVMAFLNSPEACRAIGYSEAAFHNGARAVVIQLGSIEDKLALPHGERIVLAKQTIFMELAAVFGDGAVYSSNPVLQDSTQRHLMGAMKLYQLLVDGNGTSGKTHIDANTVDEIHRLIPIVEMFFESPLIRALTQGLANYFLEKRSLSGDEIYEFLTEGWNEVNKAAERAASEEL